MRILALLLPLVFLLAGCGHKPVTVTVPGAQGKSPEELRMLANTDIARSVGLWLPCGLRVVGFPQPDISHYEWYVPKDENTHTYFQCGAKFVNSDEAREAWILNEGHDAWEIPVVQGFTTEDRFAREGLQKFYGDEDGWHRQWASALSRACLARFQPPSGNRCG